MSDLPPLAPLPTGRWKHYKGGEYEVLGLARHSETLEPMVLYRALYGDGCLWVRPQPMFLESVVVDGVLRPRFVLVAGSGDPA